MHTVLLFCIFIWLYGIHSGAHHNLIKKYGIPMKKMGLPQMNLSFSHKFFCGINPPGALRTSAGLQPVAESETGDINYC
jgi:hypothetical protein